MTNIRKLEKELWEAADLLRADSKVNSQQYCMPVLGLIFLRYAFSRFKYVEAELLKDRPSRNGRVLPVEAADFKTKSAIFLPQEARYDWLLNLSDDSDTGQAINHAMELIEKQSPQLSGILPRDYSILQNSILRELLRIFNNSALNDLKDDVIGRIYEYFLNKFAPAVASDDGVFFTPKSLVRMIVNIIEPSRGTVFDPACGSGGMFVSSADFIERNGINANTAMTFFGQEKVEYNAKLCIMNMAVHGLSAQIRYGDEANSFYNDAHNLNGLCDYVMANPPFNVDKVKAETCFNAGRLPFGLPGVNDKKKEVSNGNYLWISYFYSYLNEHGRAGFVMAASATDSSRKERDIREKLVKTGHVDVLLSVGNNFFYTKTLPCTLWFFDKGKPETLQDKVLFIDARNYYTVVDRTLNEWNEWQMKNLNAIVWLYRGETWKYSSLLLTYENAVKERWYDVVDSCGILLRYIGERQRTIVSDRLSTTSNRIERSEGILSSLDIIPELTMFRQTIIDQSKSMLEEMGQLDKYEFESLMKELSEERLVFRTYKRLLPDNTNNLTEQINEMISVLTEAKFLTDCFGDGEYHDIPGLCKIASRAEIKEKHWSLTPGAYVGVAEQQNEDDEDFAIRMKQIHTELKALQVESHRLMNTISKNFEEMGL